MYVISWIVFGLLLWIIGWALGAKSIDVFMITVVIALLAVTGRMLTPYLPGKRE